MLRIKMMTNKAEGFKVAGYCETVAEANERIEWLNWYYNPIEIYFEVVED